MPGGIGDCAAMPRPLAKIETNSSKSTAIAIACPSLAPHVDLHRLIEAVRTDAGGIVIALQEFVPVRDGLFLQAEHHPVYQRQRLSPLPPPTRPRPPPPPDRRS